MFLCIDFYSCTSKCVLKVFACTCCFRFCLSVMFFWLSCIWFPPITPSNIGINFSIFRCIFYNRFSGSKITCKCYSQCACAFHFRICIGSCCNSNFSIFLMNCHQSVFIYRCNICIGRRPCHTLIFCIIWCYFGLHLYRTFFPNRCNSRNCRNFHFFRKCNGIV